jgi:hypothetical protein
MLVLSLHVEAVDPVEGSEAVVGVRENLFPLLVRRPRAQRFDRLDDHNDRSELGPIGRRQNLRLCALGIDLEEVDGPTESVVAEDRLEAALRDGDLLGPFNGLGHAGVDRQVERRKAEVRIGQEERNLLFRLADSHAEVDVPRADLAQRLVAWIRLDVYPGPAPLVEQAGHGVDIRVGGADIHVEAGLNSAEDPPKADILRVLAVGDDRLAFTERG